LAKPASGNVEFTAAERSVPAPANEIPAYYSPLLTPGCSVEPICWKSQPKRLKQHRTCFEPIPLAHAFQATKRFFKSHNKDQSMRVFPFFIIILLLMLLTPAVLPASDCGILWLHPEQPPLTITKGYGTGTGTIDRMETFLANQMKDCRHNYESGNYERILRMIQKKENACCIPLYKTPEREKFIEFSVPYQIVLSNALIIRKSDRKKIEPFINRDGKIALEELLAKGFRVGVAKGRVYRGVIDQIIDKYRHTPSVIVHDSPEQMINSLMTMMTGGRIDALIAYPMEAQYVAKRMNIEVISLPVAGMDDYGLTSVGCSKTKEGKEIINKIDAIILKYRMTTSFMNYTEHWLDSSALERHRAFTRKEFGN
jgi:uncharacterized protein (TIGR02285 family)